MLDINPFLIVSFENIFSYSVGFVFIFSVISFALQKLSGLIRSFVYFYFCFTCLRRQIKKKLLVCLVSKSILPMFSFRCFIVSSLKFSL